MPNGLSTFGKGILGKIRKKWGSLSPEAKKDIVGAGVGVATGLLGRPREQAPAQLNIPRIGGGAGVPIGRGGEMSYGGLTANRPAAGAALGQYQSDIGGSKFSKHLQRRMRRQSGYTAGGFGALG